MKKGIGTIKLSKIKSANSIMGVKIVKFFKTARNLWAAILGLLSIFLTFVSWDNLEIFDTCLKLKILLGILVIVALISCIRTLCSHSETVWKRSEAKVCVKYGDILQEAHRHKFWGGLPNERLIVIPVNTHFDTIVEESSVPNPLVAAKTIHGKWLEQYMNDTQKSAAEIQNDIFAFLDTKNVQYENVIRPKGSNRKYALGTCAILRGTNNANFLLLAIAEFDDSNTAYTDKERVILSIHSLLDFINAQSQGVECYIPLMGTGMSRAMLTHKAALHTILSTFDLYKEKIIGALNVVIFNGDKSKVSIFDR